MIINADILDWATSYDGPLFHAALMDAPYHLTEITDRFSGEHAAPAQYGRDGAFQRMSRGFMGKHWDGVDENGVGIAFNPDTWRAIARCLHPGAFLFVFAGTLNDDLISVAMREAGLRKHHKALAWGYGSGFPKATDLPAQIDERAFQQWLATHDEERTILDRSRAKVQECRQSHKAQPTATSRALVTAAHNAYRRKRQEIKAAAGFLKTIGTRKHQPKFAAAELGYREKDNGYNSKARATFDLVVPATDLAQAWDGYAYGLQALKPAIEPILVFQKPYEGTPVDCITRTGAGALWIDGARIGTDEQWSRNNRPGQNGVFNASGGPVESDPAGRWPSNLILSHSPECNGACVPDCPVRRLGEQSGELQTHGGGTMYGIGYGSTADDVRAGGPGDSGTAARFFFQASYMYERLEAADPLFYCAKSSRAEREAGLDPRQIALLGMEEVEGQKSSPIYGDETPEGAAVRGRKPRHGFDESTINDGRQKPIDNPYQRGETTRRNIHPTIKPLSLCRYLAALLLPPAEYAPRRLLIPFAGAASEYCGAVLAGWEEIVGVEIDPDYCRIAEARAAYWRQRRHEFRDPSRPIEVKAEAVPDGQLDMFMREL